MIPGGEVFPQKLIRLNSLKIKSRTWQRSFTIFIGNWYISIGEKDLLTGTQTFHNYKLLFKVNKEEAETFSKGVQHILFFGITWPIV